MKILAMEKENADYDGETTGRLLQAEAQKAWELHQDGVIRELYFRADRPSAVLVLECPNVAEAEQVLASLPLVAAGVIEFEVHPLVPYPGFARLFANA